MAVHWFGPLALLALIVAAPAALLWLLIRLCGDVRRNEQHKRAGVRLCIECGYDLRGSADRCPECGAFQPYCTQCGNRVFRDDDERCPRCGGQARFVRGGPEASHSSAEHRG